ncbi:hypothetical protein ACS0TY_010520 [Phlomoides rotata]
MVLKFYLLCLTIRMFVDLGFCSNFHFSLSFDFSSISIRCVRQQDETKQRTIHRYLTIKT